MADKQAAAAVGQGLLIEEYTRSLLVQGVVSAQILLTQDDFADQRRYQNAQTALNVLLSRRVIPIINENDTIAIDELKVGDNDTLPTQVASLLKADLLVLLTDVPGLYSDNPRKSPDARPIPVINEITPQIFAMSGGAGSSNGTGGMAAKIKASDTATKSGVTVFICSADSTALVDAVHQKKHWLAFYAPAKARVYSLKSKKLIGKDRPDSPGRSWKKSWSKSTPKTSSSTATTGLPPFDLRLEKIKYFLTSKPDRRWPAGRRHTLAGGGHR